MTNTRLVLPGNVVTELRYEIPDDAPVTFILSSGYGNDQFREAAQQVFIELLESYGMGWVQYIYPERCRENRFTDLYISSGISTLSWIYEWLRQHSSSTICLFGYSFGANITLEVALAKSVAAVVVINTPFDYVSYRVQQLGIDAVRNWRNNYVTNLSYDNVPYPLGYRFVQEAEQQDLENRTLRIECEVHAFQAEHDAIISPSHILTLGENSRRWHPHVILGAQADHNFEHPNSLSDFLEKVRPLVASLTDIHRGEV
jgi:pimeloyl-ACP methyl ester carboxylesterase